MKVAWILGRVNFVQYVNLSMYTDGCGVLDLVGPQMSCGPNVLAVWIKGPEKLE